MVVAESDPKPPQRTDWIRGQSAFCFFRTRLSQVLVLTQSSLKSKDENQLGAETQSLFPCFPLEARDVEVRWFCSRVQLFQKFGFWAILLWKFSYHRSTQLDGMKVSVGFGVICACVTAKDAAKL